MRSRETGIAVISGLTLACIIVLILRLLTPAMCEMAVSKLQSDFTLICNEEVLSYIEKENLSAEDFVTVSRREDKIGAINTDMTKVNKMKAALSVSIQKRLDKIKTVPVHLPPNGIFGLGGGVEIPLSVLSVNALKCDMKSSFKAAGINQTRLKIYADFSVSGEILIFANHQTLSVSVSVPVCDTVIVGDVPSTYLNVERK